MALRSNIIKLRTDRKMTQEGLAEKLGVSRQAVQKWESGDFVPELNRLQAMAKLFDVSLDELVGGDALSTISAKRKNKRKKEALIFVIVAMVVALAGMTAMGFRDVWSDFKVTIPIEEAEELMDSYREIGRDIDETLEQEFYGNVDMIIPAYWDDWDTRGMFCYVNDPSVEGSVADNPKQCLRRDLENERAATMVMRYTYGSFALMWAYNLFALAAYLVVYATIKYKFGRFWVYVFQAVTLGLLLMVAILLSVMEAYEYQEWILHPGFASLAILPLGYALANILIFGKRGLEAELD